VRASVKPGIIGCTKVKNRGQGDASKVKVVEHKGGKIKNGDEHYEATQKPDAGVAALEGSVSANRRPGGRGVSQYMHIGRPIVRERQEEMLKMIRPKKIADRS